MKRYSLILLVALAVCVGAYQFAHATGEPWGGTVHNTLTRTLYGPTAIVTDTVYSAPSATALGGDAQNFKAWNEADIFIKSTVAASASLVATVQFSPDCTNYADGYFWGQKSDGTVVSNAYAVSVSSTGVNYIRVPVTGECIRVKLVTLGTVIPTVIVTLRNN